MSDTQPSVFVSSARSPKWIPEQDERLKALRAELLSSGQIADLMGKTRNSIIGRLARLGLKCESQPHSPGRPRAKPSSESRGLVQRVQAAERSTGKAFANVARRVSRPPAWEPAASRPDGGISRRQQAERAAAAPPAAEPTPASAVSLLDLTADTCRWPLWGDDAPSPYQRAYCGCGVATGLAYCGFHAAICYRGTDRDTLPRRWNRGTIAVVRP
jgi:hypothetical protein